jgi:hypothetical protein
MLSHGRSLMIACVDLTSEAHGVGYYLYAATAYARGVLTDWMRTSQGGRDEMRTPRGHEKVQQWLKEAFGAGHVSALLDGDFPRYAWKRVEGQVYEPRLSNAGLGQYKGYPIEAHEAPRWLE